MFIGYSEVSLLFYLLIFLASILVMLTSKYDSKYIDYANFIVIVFICLLFILSRTGFGVDEPTYLKNYVSYLNTGLSDYDVGFNFFSYLASKLGITYRNYNNFLCSLILIIASVTIIYCVKKNNRAISLLFLIFSFFFIDLQFNAYRQCLSVLFLLISISAYYRGENLLFIIFTVFAILFHWAVLVVYIVFFISMLINIKNTNKYYILFSILLCILFFVKPGLLDLLVNIVKFFPFDSQLFTKIEAYTKYTYGNGFYDLNYNGRAGITSSILFFSSLIIFVGGEFYKSKLSKFIIIYLFFCLSLIEMAYSFRNFYWVLPFIIFVIDFFCNENNRFNRTTKYIILIFVFNIFYLPMFFSSALIKLLFSI